jgi:hypothetical protein
MVQCSRAGTRSGRAGWAEASPSCKTRRRAQGEASASPSSFGVNPHACASVLSPEPRRDELIRELPCGIVSCQANSSCERGANISASTRVLARVTLPRQIRSVCGAFVDAATLACPRFPPLAQDGKEGVDGSSPSEGFEKPLQIGGFFPYGVVHVDGARSHQSLRSMGRGRPPLYRRLDRDPSFRKRPWIWFMRRIAARRPSRSRSRRTCCSGDRCRRSA